MTETLRPFTHERASTKPEAVICQLDLGTQADNWRNPTVYNPSTFFELDGQMVLLARLEEADDETSSTVVLCTLEKGDVLTLVEDAPQFPGMQDPYYLGTFKDPDDPDGLPYHIIGGVKITVDEAEKVVDWQDHSFLYKESLDETLVNGQPMPFLTSAHRSKDLRYVQMDNYIVACPRPQGAFGGIGKIGFFKTDDIDTLQQDLIEYFDRADESTLVEGLFEEGEWGGINQMIPQPDGTIAIIGHKAHKEVRDGSTVLCYRPFSGILDPATGKLTGPIKTLDISPDYFEQTISPKRPDLDDVVFTGGIQAIENDPTTVRFVGGFKDAVVGIITIPNPFLTSK